MEKKDLTKLEKATFAGGCFWCMEYPFDRLKGVYATISGYTGGHVKDPGYEDVCSGTTGHTEAVQVFYEPKEITYQQLLDAFWQNINPTTPEGQFADVGSQYRPEIFYHNEEQKKLAEASREALDQSGRFDAPIAVPISKADVFYPAEDYHQDYYKKNPVQYKFYRMGSGRDQYLKQMWGKERQHENN